uniref:Uncharacterized protein n=1 Tax=Candidatus Kentrum sp. SD TaxID=2126332 RepID=A0A450Z0A2_9GAMM|nr:MAG: hypothetical protein BECKSD772F_GA0070984_10913 [Candidatus Kentron sp. SD]VFK47187.1 MAG: hypothetical protein BECKSD772E_GA0070983_10893 [Candidatus Kentron sp. SD]VFK80363.1 MAG: hypothetical protein BECKSD772D_GA0070982_110613 [Candidatus Kentron sp. SD]
MRDRLVKNHEAIFLISWTKKVRGMGFFTILLGYGSPEFVIFIRKKPILPSLFGGAFTHRDERNVFLRGRVRFGGGKMVDSAFTGA